MNHTPGPWKIDKVLTMNAAPIITAETCWRNQSRVVAKAMYHSGSEDPEVQANAKLIAATPDLLEALREALDFIERFGKERHLSAKDAQCAHCILIESAKTAIAKATQ